MADGIITHDEMLAFARGQRALADLQELLADLFGDGDFLTLSVAAANRGVGEMLENVTAPSDLDWVARELAAEAEHLRQRSPAPRPGSSAS